MPIVLRNKGVLVGFVSFLIRAILSRSEDSGPSERIDDSLVICATGVLGKSDGVCGRGGAVPNVSGYWDGAEGKTLDDRRTEAAL